MKKVKEFVFRHKISSVIIFLFIFSFCYSQITSYFLPIKVNQTVESIPFMKLEFDEIKDYLKDENYEVKVYYEQDYNKITITATKNKERIVVKSLEDANFIDYLFENTPESITPMLSNVKWNDNNFMVQLKTGINFFNTRFTRLHKGLGTKVHLHNNFILIMADENSRYAYDFTFDENNKLYKINVTAYK